MKQPCNSRHDVFTVVLTGGIASGKTAVSDHFAALGVPVIDTDIIARAVVAPGTAGLTEIAATFGEDYIDQDGQLDRAKMRETIFSNPGMKSLLEAILHPLIAAEAQKQVAEQDSAYCILVIPLFSESGRYDWIDRVLVVDVAEDTQLERVMKRDGISRNQALAILDAQASRKERLALADDVLENSGSLEELHEEVEALHQKYLTLTT